MPDRPNANIDAVRANAVAYDSLVAYWPLDEGRGSWVWDLTGNGNDGTFQFEPMWRPVGFPSAAFRNPSELQFDGIDDFVEFTAKTIPDVDKPKTISLWARYDYEVDPAKLETLVALLNRNAAAGVRVEFRGGRLAVTGYFFQEIVSLPAPAIGWHHFVYTFDGNTHALYIDAGTAATSMIAAEVGSINDPTNGRCRIARSSSGVPDAYRGFLDDVRIYNRALTAAEVRSLFLGAP